MLNFGVHFYSITKLCQHKLNDLVLTFLSKLEKKPEELSLDKWLVSELMQLHGNKNQAWPDNETFKNSIRSREFNTPNIPRLFLWEIEKTLSGKEVVSFDNISLEYILPQTLNDAWRSDLGEDADSIHKQFCYVLGNMSLTKLNSEISNRPFSEKCSFYKASGIALNREIANMGWKSWGKEEILERYEFLAERAIKIWAYPDEINHCVSTINSDSMWTGKNPIKIHIDETVLNVNSWKDALIKFQIHADKHHHEKFMICVRDKIFPWLSPSEDQKTFEFIQENMSAEDIKRKIKRISLLLDISEPFIDVLAPGK